MTQNSLILVCGWKVCIKSMMQRNLKNTRVTPIVKYMWINSDIHQINLLISTVVLYKSKHLVEVKKYSIFSPIFQVEDLHWKFEKCTCNLVREGSFELLKNTIFFLPLT